MGVNPQAGRVMTTQGYRERRPPRCMKCGERKDDGLYTVNPNGQAVCPDCAGAKHAAVLKGTSCGPDCTCSPECRDGGEG